MLVFAVLSMLFTLPVTAAGPGSGGGGSGSGGETGGEAPEDYSELVVALRDEFGRPELIGPYWSIERSEGGTATVVPEWCVQPVSPVAIPRVDSTVNPVDGRTVWRIPLYADDMTPGDLDDPPTVEELEALEIEVEACDPKAEYAMYVAEAELERLNMARTQEDQILRKIADVEERLIVADELTLDGAGRLVIDGAMVDAGPEHAGMFRSLMTLGYWPGTPTEYLTGAGGSVEVEPPEASGPISAQELAAVSIGAAASKFTPISLDAVVYYVDNVTGLMAPPTTVDDEPVPGTVLFPQLTLAEDAYPVDQAWLDMREFTYTRSEFFPGAVTSLDVPTLTWETEPILDVVDYTNLTPAIGHDTELHGIVAFAQLVEDVRATILYYHEYEGLVGFYMDPPRVNTIAAQLDKLSAPAVDLGPLPASVVQTDEFPVSASLFLPWAATAISDARLRVTVETDAGFGEPGTAPVQVTASDGQAMPFMVVDRGDDPSALVGWWGPEGGFLVEPGDQATTDFTASILRGAPAGTYGVTLELVSVGSGDVKATDGPAMMEVLPPALTATWVSNPEYVTQGTYAPLVARVFNPEPAQADPGAEDPTAVEPATGPTLRLTVRPTGDPALLEGHGVRLYWDAYSIPLVLTVEATPEGDVTTLQGDFTLPPLPPKGTLLDGATEPATGVAMVTAYLISTGEYDPIGWYELDIEVLADEAAPDVGPADMTEMYLAPAPTHGGQPGAFGMTMTTVSLGADPEFQLAVTGDTYGVILQYRMELDGEPWAIHGGEEEEEVEVVEEGEDLVWTICTPRVECTVTFEDLADGDWEFFARAKRGEDIETPTPASIAWTVDSTTVPTIPGGGGGTDPTTTTTTTAPAGGGGGGGGEVPSDVVMTELAGDDRVATAIEVSEDEFPAKAGAAVLANAGVFADALAGTPLAVAENAPMLLTYTGELDSRVAAELDRVLTPGATVFLLGGTAALSDTVEAAVLQMGYDVVRYGGGDRYATSVAVAEGLGNPTTVFLTTGHSFADGLTAGTAAATVGGAVLLTDGDAMAAPVVAHLAAHPAQVRYAVGGPATRADTGAEAIAGADRFATAAMVAGTFFPAPAFVGMASGETFPDALSGGVASAMHGGPLMLSASSALSTATAGYLTGHADTIEEVQFYGGPAALSQAVRDAVAVSLG
ncbi:MAG TPA: hypothetical protein DCS55_16950 [Acidimicrobiaceae bacterium]|nr:hypothetical protein [Acidimicrobiaceae bacterium]